MSNIQILDNSTIHKILINLSREEATSFLQILEKTFQDVSVNGESTYQPPPSTTTRPNGQSTLFRPFTSESSVGAKIVVEPAPSPDGKKDPLSGIIVLTDEKGQPKAVLSSEEVTGYRTSMNAMVPFCWRRRVEHVVVFGAGVQALWHTRLILTLRGEDVKDITFVSPTRARVEGLIQTLTSENQERWKSEASLHYLDTTSPTYQDSLKTLLGSANAIFCTTPSQKPLFPTPYLTQTDRDPDRQPFISAIGSWQPHMIELEHELLHHAISVTSNGHGYNPVPGENEGVVLTDDRAFALRSCGELVGSGILERDVVELGEVVGVRGGKGVSGQDQERIAKTNKLVEEGFVVYKSVGVSLTDLTVSNAILELAKGKEKQ